MSNKKYYMNEECDVLMRNDSLSTIRMSLKDYEDEEAEAVIVVHNSLVTDKKINKSDVLLDIENEGRIQKAKIRNELNDLRIRLNKERRDLLDEVEKTRERLNKYDSMDVMYKFLNGDYKYFIEDSDDSLRLVDINKVNVEDEFDSELRCVIFRSSDEIRKRGKSFGLSLGRYSDASGGNTPIVGFETIDEAVTELQRRIDKYPNNRLRPCMDQLLVVKKLGVKSKKLDLMIAEIEAKRIAKKNEDIESYRKELQKVENAIKRLQDESE